MRRRSCAGDIQVFGEAPPLARSARPERLKGAAGRERMSGSPGHPLSPVDNSCPKILENQLSTVSVDSAQSDVRLPRPARGARVVGRVRPGRLTLSTVVVLPVGLAGLAAAGRPFTG